MGVSLTVFDSGNRAVLKAVSTVQTVLLMDDTGAAFFYRLLRTDTDTFPTANAGVCNQIPFRSDFSVSDGVAFPENRIYTEIEILD